MISWRVRQRSARRRKAPLKRLDQGLRRRRVTGSGLLQAWLLLQTVGLTAGALAGDGAQARNAGMMAVLAGAALLASTTKNLSLAELNERVGGARVITFVATDSIRWTG